ncbi:polysaccharide deacetylase family protein [Enterococcus ratti]|uniref:polysaccharide deacetylase family protein n=1 Tax=Enterococcus ratti TaxID=150033 RepID=UPI003517B02E
MPDKKNYVRRSQRHKQTLNTYKKSDQLHATVSKERTKAKMTKRNLAYRKYIFSLLIALTLIIIATGGYIIYTLKQQEAKAHAKYEVATKELIASIQKEQEQNGISVKIDTVSDGKNKCLIYSPSNENNIPFKNVNQTLKKLAQKQHSKHNKKEVLTIAKIKITTISSKAENYQIEAISFVWDRNKEHFHKSDSISEKSIYVSKKTGKEITTRDLIPDEEGLLGIQQVIQQTILNNTKEPEKIIDAVLTMDRISYDNKMTYTPTELAINLKKNKTGTTKVTLKYKDIAPFINTELVSSESIKDAFPTLNKNKKYVALTFDDGPNNSSTLDLLNILKKENVKATFFMLGQMVEQNPHVARQVHEEGHEIASHSYSHPQLNTLPKDSLQNEINKTNKAIFKATGVLPQNIRPPYGAIDKSSAETIGMPIVQWAIDSQDWKLRNSDATIKNILNQPIYNGAIILLHDIHRESVIAVSRLITILKNKGYEFVTINQLLSGKQKPLYQYFGMNDKRIVD